MLRAGMGCGDGVASQNERMLAGELYLADDPELAADARRAAGLAERFNATDAGDPERRRVLAELLGHLGEGAEIRSPLRVDYGAQITVGAASSVNVGAVLLDVARITIVCRGVTIGQDSVVGAGSVVTRDLPPNVLAVGSRAAEPPG